MALRPQGSEPGLKAFEESREYRRRAVVLGKVRVRENATRFWLMTFAAFALFGVVYWQYAKVQLAGAKSDVLSQRRALAVVLDDSTEKARANLEGLIEWLATQPTRGLAAEVAVRPEVLAAVRKGPGIYARLGLNAALGDKKMVRQALKRSGHDGFTSCFYAGNAVSGEAPKACRTNAECGPGMYCGGRGGCVAPTQPYDLHWLNDGLMVLNESWERALVAASNEYKVRAFELTLATVAKHEAPIAAEMVRRSEYFTVVLDEGDKLGVGGVLAKQEARRRLRSSGHFARLGIWRLRDKELVAALRLRADGKLMSAGTEPTGKQAVGESDDGERAMQAAQRQSNDCALATEARDALKPQLPSAG